VQYRFHREIDALYAIPQLTALLPDLPERRRLLKIANDLNDLEQVPPPAQAARLGISTPVPVALGWLYVAEGSNLGATILYKMAGEKLGLDRNMGARHLAAHPDGAARHWREFTRILDAAVLTEQEETMTLQAAENAFTTVSGYAEDELFHEHFSRLGERHEA
jgi:heme oxygenase